MDYSWRNDDFGNPAIIGGVATLNDYKYTDGAGSATTTCDAANYEPAVFLEEPNVVCK